MKIQRHWVTPFTAGAFLLSAVTGILMFFHLDSGGNKAIHEWFGWVLLSGVVLHATANFTAFKNHLASRRGQILIGIFAVLLLVSFTLGGKEKGKKGGEPFMQPVRALSQAPLSTLAQVAKITPEQLHERLSNAGVQTTSDQQSLSDLVGPDMRKQRQAMEAVFTADK